jgi:processive 1,2-diacylglycerol beta-glucosyltransferase
MSYIKGEKRKVHFKKRKYAYKTIIQSTIGTKEVISTVAPRVLILSASVGAGHLRAAQALELALRQIRPDTVVRNLDVLELTNVAFRRLYSKAYLDLVRRAPHVLGYMYDRLDKPDWFTRRGGDHLRQLLERLNLKPFIDLLTSESWDLVLSTHFLPAGIVASLKNKNRLHLPHVTVTTDFDTHRLWVNQPCERYFTATEEGKINLAAWKIPSADIIPTGIPIHPVFVQPKNRQDCRHRHGLSGDRPIVLQLAGGFGVGSIARIYQSLLTVEQPLEVIAVTGHNIKVKQQLESVPCPPRHRYKILGFTDQIDELMAAADIVISKPGGLTTAEILARGAAMVIVDPIPGQEIRNSDFLLENGAAIKVNNLATLAYKVSTLLADPDRLEQLRANAQRISRPRAAFDIVERSLELLVSR